MNDAIENRPAAECDYCGRKNPDALASCPGCGTMLVEEAPSTPKPPEIKSRTTAVMLALAFGPVGFCYTDMFWGRVLIVIRVFLIFVTRSFLVAIVMRVICAGWAYMEMTKRGAPDHAGGDAQSLLNEAARFEGIDPVQALARYEQVAALFPNTRAAKEATETIKILNSKILAGTRSKLVSQTEGRE